MNSINTQSKVNELVEKFGELGMFRYSEIALKLKHGTVPKFANIEVCRAKQITAERTVPLLRPIFARLGVPTTIVSATTWVSFFYLI